MSVRAALQVCRRRLLEGPAESVPARQERSGRARAMHQAVEHRCGGGRGRAMNAVPKEMNQDIVLAADQLTKHYDVKRSAFKHGTVKALNGVSFELKRGRTLAVVGESGCGKSTLARQLTMIETPTSGRLLIEGDDVAGASKAKIAELRQRVQMVFQNPF